MNDAKKLKADYNLLNNHNEKMDLLANNLEHITSLPDVILLEVIAPYNCDNIDYQPQKVQEVFKIALDELCDRKRDIAIQKRGYCFYSGTKIYPTNIFKAKEAFLEHYNMTGNTDSANTLGYIFYYGRTNRGIPEYDKAFKYFSIGNFGGSIESKYKLADMFYHGYYVIKNVNLAYDKYQEMYNFFLDKFLKGDYYCKFADLALRLGRCFYEGEYMSYLEMAYTYYLQADFAIRKRMEEHNFYGDTSIFRNIQTTLNEIRDEYFREKPKTLKYYLRDFEWIENILGYGEFLKGRYCKATYKILKSGELQLSFKIFNESIDFLITIPSADYCDVKDKFQVKTEGFKEIFINPDKPYLDETKDKNSFLFTSINYNILNFGKEPIEFYFYDEMVARISCEKIYYYTPPKKKKYDLKHHFVSVSFNNSYKTYDYLCDDLTVKVGDTVIVDTFKGEQEVRVVKVFDMFESQLVMPYEMYKKVERKL